MTIAGDKLKELIAAAQKASERAYCPYSRFRVGAAALAKSGVVGVGCNVENASFGLTICAERNAIFQLIARGESDVVAVVIYTPTKSPTAPCGACRQVLNEFGPDMEVLSVCDGPGTIRTTLAELLPDAFGPNSIPSPLAGEG